MQKFLIFSKNFKNNINKVTKIGGIILLILLSTLVKLGHEFFVRENLCGWKIIMIFFFGYIFLIVSIVDLISVG